MILIWVTRTFYFKTQVFNDLYDIINKTDFKNLMDRKNKKIYSNNNFEICEII